jgi:hypothetical protein
LLAAKIVPALIFSAIFFVAMLVNLYIADRIAPRHRAMGTEDEIIEKYRTYVAPTPAGCASVSRCSSPS